MKISGILIEDRIKEKILYKHNVHAFEIKEILFDNPYILKIRDSRYMAIGKNDKFLTIIFEVENRLAFILTAYPSSDAQRKLFKSKRKL